MARPAIYHRGTSSLGKAVFFFIGFAVTMWAGGLYLFASNIPAHVGDEQTPTDAIVVLTGGSGRVDTGLELLAGGISGKMFVSGVYKGVDVATLLRLSKESPQELSCCIGIGHAEDTIDNARETASWATENNVASIRLVTSAYHMPRAVLEFSNTMPRASIIPHPVFSDQVKQENWWIWPGTTDLIVSEYNKYMLAWLRHRLRRLLVNLPRGG